MAGLTLRKLPRRGQRRVDVPALLWRMRWFGAAVAVAGLVFYGILWVLFARAGAHAGEYLEQALGAPVRVESVRVARGFRVDLSGVTVYEPGGKRAAGTELMTARRVSLWPEWTWLALGRFRARRVEVWSPRLMVRRAPGGGTGVDSWVRRAAQPRKGAARAFPALLEIHGGSALVQLSRAPGAAFLVIEGVNGRAGRAPRGAVALDFKAAVFGSEFTLRGLVRPDSPADLFDLETQAPFFAFSELADLVVRSWPEAADGTPELALGTGRLDARITGAPGSLRVTGAAALRDFDADFHYEKRVLRLSRINAGAGAQKVSGSATLDMAAPSLPFTLRLDFRGLDLAELMTPAAGFQYAPQGEARGELRVSGALGAGSAPEVGGRIAVRDGALRIPLLRAGPGPSPFGNTASIPFDSLSADFTAASQSLALENLRVTGPGYTINGRADLGGAPADLSGFQAPFAYSADLQVSAQDLSQALGSVPAWSGLASGALKGRLRLRGDLGREGSAAGTAHFTITRGALYNPYAVPGAWGGDADFAFDRISCDIRLENRALNFSGTLADGGLAMSWDGRTAARDGSLRITGRAQADARAAARFQGLAPFVRPDPPGMRATYSAAVRVTGSLQAPVTAWTRLRIVRRPAPAPHFSTAP